MRRWFQGLASFLQTAESVPPILLRIGSTQARASAIDVRAVWSPSGRSVRSTVIAANGVCLVPWVAGHDAVELTVRVRGVVGELRVEAREAAEGRVFDVPLVQSGRSASTTLHPGPLVQPS